MPKNYERYLEIIKESSSELDCECDECEQLSSELDDEEEEVYE